MTICSSMLSGLSLEDSPLSEWCVFVGHTGFKLNICPEFFFCNSYFVIKYIGNDVLPPSFEMSSVLFKFFYIITLFSCWLNICLKFHKYNYDTHWMVITDVIILLKKNSDWLGDQPSFRIFN